MHMNHLTILFRQINCSVSVIEEAHIKDHKTLYRLSENMIVFYICSN